jgi:hypothetical protein
LIIHHSTGTNNTLTDIIGWYKFLPNMAMSLATIFFPITRLANYPNPRGIVDPTDHRQRQTKSLSYNRDFFAVLWQHRKTQFIVIPSDKS